MAISTGFVLAGIGAAGPSSAELVWFAPVGTAAPTDATSALNTTPASEVQTVTITGTPTGGTFTLTYNGATTAGIAYNAAGAAVQTALTGLSTIGAGNVAVTGSGPYTVTFQGTLADQGVELLIGSPTGLTGGTNATVTAVRTTTGTTGWLSAGLITEDGVSKDIKENSKEIRAYGLATPVRKIVTSSDITFKTTFMETNPVASAVYNRMPLGSVKPVGGAFTTTDGQYRSQKYAAVVHATDGLNIVRMVLPIIEVTERDGFQIKNGEVIQYGTGFTAYPDATGVSAYTHHVVQGL